MVRARWSYWLAALCCAACTTTTTPPVGGSVGVTHGGGFSTGLGESGDSDEGGDEGGGGGKETSFGDAEWLATVALAWVRWCPGQDSNLHGQRPDDFKSPAFTISPPGHGGHSIPSSNRAPRVGECIAVARFDPDASARVADVECGAATDEDDLLSFTLLNTRTGNILNLIN